VAKKSVLNWGWRIIGHDSDVNDIYFVKVKMDRLKKSIERRHLAELNDQ